MEGYMDEGFAMLKEKETKLLPILSRYEYADKADKDLCTVN